MFIAVLLKRTLIIGTLLAMTLGLNCNIFSPFNPIDSSSDYLSEGRKAYWNEDYIAAADYFEMAKEIDPSNGDAYWWHAKAVIRTTNFTTISLVETITSIDTIFSLAPFTNLNANSANTIYEAIIQVNEDHFMIFYNHVEVSEFKARAVVLDYAISLLIQIFLNLADTNSDNIIGNNDLSLNAVFQNGEFIIPEDPWNLLSNDEKRVFIDRMLILSDHFKDTAEQLLEDFAGFEIDELNNIVNMIEPALENIRP